MSFCIMMKRRLKIVLSFQLEDLGMNVQYQLHLAFSRRQPRFRQTEPVDERRELWWSRTEISRKEY